MTIRGATSRMIHWVGGLPVRRSLAKRKVSEPKSAIEGPSVALRQAELLSFYDHFEELVEVLVSAAQYGATPKLEQRYSAAKAWMDAHYQLVRPYVVAYLLFDPEDSEQSLRLEGHSGDAFEALFAAPDLDSFLRADDGKMISRIMRAREALNLYGEHLRYLLARE